MTSPIVITGGMCQCTTFGLAPANLVFLPTCKVLGTPPVGDILKFTPFLNVLPFIGCRSPLNPATLALNGGQPIIAVPGPCTPTIVSPWITTAMNILISSFPAIVLSSMTFCAFGGVIKITTPGQFKIMA